MGTWQGAQSPWGWPSSPTLKKKKASFLARVPEALLVIFDVYRRGAGRMNEKNSSIASERMSLDHIR